MRCSALVLAVALALGCNSQICARNSDCAAGLVCSDQGQCVHPDPATATAPDAPGDGGADGPTDAPFDAPTDAAVDAAPLDASIGVASLGDVA
jgi:hypothetical protein